MVHGVLASAGCVNGRTLTSWPGIRDDMVNAGATWLDEAVVRDGNLVTSRGPQDLIPFIRAMKALFAEPYRLRRRTWEKRPSAPQRNEPPQLMLSVMKWMPRPSLRTAMGLAAIFAIFTTPPKTRSRSVMPATSETLQRTSVA